MKKFLVLALTSLSIYSCGQGNNTNIGQKKSTLNAVELAESLEYRRIMTLDADKVKLLALDPMALKGKIPDLVLLVAKDRRMLKSYKKLLYVLKQATTPDEEDTLLSSIRANAYVQGNTMTLLVEASGDDRSDSTYSFQVDVNIANSEIVSWSKVEFTDHP